jgi:hypothetical protein
LFFAQEKGVGQKLNISLNLTLMLVYVNVNRYLIDSKNIISLKNGSMLHQ